MRGAAEHSAGAVAHQHEIGDVEGVFSASEGVHHFQAGVESLFLGFLDRLFRGAELATFLNECGGGGIVRRHALRQRMLGRDGNEAHAVKRIGAGGVDLDIEFNRVAVGLAAQHFQRHQRAGGFTNPFFLHDTDFIRPVGEGA